MATFNHRPVHLTRKAQKRLVLLQGAEDAHWQRGTQLLCLCWVPWELEMYEFVFDHRVGKCFNQRVRSESFCMVTTPIEHWKNSQHKFSGEKRKA